MGSKGDCIMDILVLNRLKAIRDTFGNYIKYDLALNRTQNWRVNPSDGATV